jgi:hypothetical protein
MALERKDFRDEGHEVGSAAWTSSASFVVPMTLLIAAALMGWILYGSLSPTVDNTGTTTPVTQTDLPQAKPLPTAPQTTSP